MESLKTRVDWDDVKARIDLAMVATNLLGPHHKRAGSRFLWPCPFHDDHDPSFQVDAARQTWRCWVCAVGGDAAELVKRVSQCDFPTAVRYLAELVGVIVPRGSGNGAALANRLASDVKHSSLVKTEFCYDDFGCKIPPQGPTGLPVGEASELASGAAVRLWEPAGESALRYLRGRGLSIATIRAAGLGFTPGVMVPTKDGDRAFRFAGIVIPWRSGARLTRIKIRRLDDGKPKYAEAFSDHPLIYPDPDIIRPGYPLVISEGEFDELLLGQQLPEASVITLGSASARTEPDVLVRMLAAYPWFAALDADQAGDSASSRFPARAIRVRPPDGKDWTELHASGRHRIRYHWGRFLPLSQSWEELESFRRDSTAEWPYEAEERLAIQQE